MFCGNCGKEIPNDAKFCNHCGALQNNTSMQGSTSSQQTYTPNRQDTASGSKLSARTKLSAVLVVVVMVAAASVIAYWDDIFGRKQPDMNTPDNAISSNHYEESKQPEGLDEELYPFYALLSDKKKVVYEEALACIENGGNGFTPSYELDQETISTILKYIYYDQPQLFWYAPDDSSISCDGDAGDVLEIIPGYNDLANDLEYNRQFIEGVADQLLNETNALSDVEAEKFFHDYICRNTAYQLGTHDQNIYSVFVENKTVCAGYTRALQYLMIKRGVPCYYCTGTLYSEEKSDWVYHAWNIIKLDGNYYNCDLTWDDFYNETDKYPSYIGYEHFNTSDAQYILDVENSLGRLRTGDGIVLPACNADDLNYQALYGMEWEYDVIWQLGLDGTYMVDSVDSFFDFLYNQAISRGIGNHSLTFIVKGSDTLTYIQNLSNDEYLYRLIDPVANYIGRSGWTGLAWEYNWYPLWPFDEYYYVEYQLNFV